MMMNPLTLRAREIMETDVVELHTLTPIKEAIETFEEFGIHGAPVVNEAGELVGTLTSSDILKYDQAQEEVAKGGHPGAYYARDPLLESEDEEDEQQFSREEYPPEVLERAVVADWMTPEVISVRPDANLAEVCATMAKERIHRVFVVEEGEVLGVISTFDVVRRIAAEASVGIRG